MAWKKYKCVRALCGKEFKKYVVYTAGIINDVSGKQARNGISSQVQCPYCKCLMPTWEKRWIDGKYMRVERREMK